MKWVICLVMLYTATPWEDSPRFDTQGECAHALEVVAEDELLVVPSGVTLECRLVHAYPVDAHRS